MCLIISINHCSSWSFQWILPQCLIVPPLRLWQRPSEPMVCLQHWWLVSPSMTTSLWVEPPFCGFWSKRYENHWLLNITGSSHRKCMCTRRPCRLWCTPSPAQRPTISWCGQPRLPHTASSVRVCCGVWPGKECGVQSVGWRRMRNARTCSMQTACSVSTISNTSSSAGTYWSIDQFVVKIQSLEFQIRGHLPWCHLFL